VTKVGKDYFEINVSPHPHGERGQINPQDGLCFFNNNELQGCLVNKTESNKIFPNKMAGIRVGTEIYRNLDFEFEKSLKNSKTCRKIGVNIDFALGSVIVIDENDSSAKINYQFEELAQNKEKMSENIIKQMSKSGESDFLVENVKISTDKIPFLPVSKLNELRRELLDALAKKRTPTFKKIKNNSNYNQVRLSPKKLDYRANISNKQSKEFYENFGFSVEEMALELGTSAKGKAVMTTKHCLKHAFNMCKSSKKLFLLDEKGKKYELQFDCKKCEMKIIF
jgi:putative protease